jgi:hypothetical protein
MAVTIPDTDVKRTIDGLRHAARDERNWDTTVGRDDPPNIRKIRAERIDNWERIAREIEQRYES